MVTKVVRDKEQVLDTQMQRTTALVMTGKGEVGEDEMEQGVNCMVMDGNKTLGCEHAAVYMDIFIKYCVHGTYEL